MGAHQPDGPRPELGVAMIGYAPHGARRQGSRRQDGVGGLDGELAEGA
jgi:hypothetical protein